MGSTTPILNNLITTTSTLLTNSLHLKNPPSHFSLPLHSPHAPPQRLRITRVTTAPVEYAPSPSPDFNLHEEIARLNSLRADLAKCRTLREKLRVISGDSRVREFFVGDSDGFSRFGLSSEELFLLKCLVAAGQEHVVRSGIEVLGRREEKDEKEGARGAVKSALYALIEMIERLDGGTFVKSGGGVEVEGGEHAEVSENLIGLLKTLAEIERFYDCIGGIIGYQVTVLELLAESTTVRHTINWSKHIQKSEDCQFLEVHPPSGLDLSQDTDYASQAALWGIEGLPDLGEIYPLGGSADRLGLVDPETGECLPAAMLPYCGRTLLEGLIRDLQAREFLYFKLHGSQCITPVAIMTSSAKNNHERITTLCERLQWFGRGRSSFKLFEQPLVPAVSMEGGQWLVNKPFTPLCKPGGHGVIWKLAYDNGVFDWFYDHGRKGATVRQVSNVVAATDLTLLALAGIGLHHGKKLGFASCKRNSAATEGINVLMEKKNLDGMWAYGLSCIEYTEFEKFGIVNGPLSLNGFQAEFPANTNILYVDLHSAESVASSKNKNSLPGMVLNVKKKIEYMDHFGRWQSIRGGRLECTMQNIADNFLNTYPARRYKGVEDQLNTYIVYNERRRVTSSAKKKRRHADKSLHQTPDGSLLDIMRNAYDLLSQCNIKLSKVETNDKYINSGPPFLILLHPALGPLWEVSRQKFCGGSISEGSELQVEIAEFLWKDVQLDGSLIILAGNVLGSTRMDDNGAPILQYGHRCSRCKLQNVKVLNAGIDWNNGNNTYWKNDVNRFEALKVILHGNAEFEACNVTIQGNHVFEVPDGNRLKITQGNPGLAVQLDPIEQNMMDTGSWYWEYKKVGTHIKLELVKL